MKNKVLALSIITLLSTSFAAAEFKKDVTKSVSDLISTSKDAISGIKDGITDGRKQGSSDDGSIIISTTEEMKPYITFKLRNVEKLSKDSYKLTLIFTNSHSESVRLINIDDAQQVLLLDEDRITSPLSKSVTSDSHNKDITIPKNAATRINWTFDNVESAPAFLRIYGTEYSIKDIQK